MICRLGCSVRRQMERIRARIPLDSDDELSDNDDVEYRASALPAQPGKYCCEKHERWCRERTLQHIAEHRFVA